MIRIMIIIIFTITTIIILTVTIMFITITTITQGETATDLADPEDFKMLAVLRNTQVDYPMHYGSHPMENGKYRVVLLTGSAPCWVEPSYSSSHLHIFLLNRSTFTFFG